MKKLFLFSFLALTACQQKAEQQSDGIAKTDSTKKKNADFSPVTAEVDTDKDGKMSTVEWKKSGLPESSFKMFEKGRGYVTQEDYDKNPAPDGIDINGDGKLTVAEFKEFDKIMAEKMKRPLTPEGGTKK